jgi:hypothetical protein
VRIVSVNNDKGIGATTHGMVSQSSETSMMRDLAFETLVQKGELSFGTPLESAAAKLRFVQVPEPFVPVHTWGGVVLALGCILSEKSLTKSAK